MGAAVWAGVLWRYAAAGQCRAKPHMRAKRPCKGRDRRACLPPFRSINGGIARRAITVACPNRTPRLLAKAGRVPVHGRSPGSRVSADAAFPRLGLSGMWRGLTADSRGGGCGGARPEWIRTFRIPSSSPVNAFASVMGEPCPMVVPVIRAGRQGAILIRGWAG